MVGVGFQCCPVLTMALTMVNSLRIHAVSATFFGLPADTRRLYKARITGLYLLATSAPM